MNCKAGQTENGGILYMVYSKFLIFFNVLPKEAATSGAL